MRRLCLFLLLDGLFDTANATFSPEAIPGADDAMRQHHHDDDEQAPEEQIPQIRDFVDFGLCISAAVILRPDDQADDQYDDEGC